MNFEVFLSKRAEKDFLNLDEQTRFHIKEKILSYAFNPFIHARKLSNSNLGTYRFRIGDYRIIADIEENKIIILRIGHRRDIYK
jgi:mRNA interferase RelE/StbE